jgi:hypothetical protein
MTTDPERYIVGLKIKNMKRTFLHVLMGIISGILLFSCSHKPSQGIKKSITGNAGEMVVVMANNLWDSTPGEALKKNLGQPQLSLPQDEPLFNLIHIPHNAFENIFKTTRNIVMTHIESRIETSGVFFKDDVWAHPQATVEIRAKSMQEFNNLVTENSGKMISYFLQAEKERLQTSYRRIHDKGVLNKLQEKFDITLYCAPGFKLAVETDDFIWYRFDTPDITQGIFIYSVKYTSDSIFTPDYLIYKRNQLLRENVPGPTDGSYMSTEMRLEPVFQVFEHNGNYAAEMRGLWNTENDFMGGPFVMIAELDAANQRVVIAEGFVYAPGEKKRNFLRQVEAMIYSMKFTDQAKNDKINSQVKMGN